MLCCNFFVENMYSCIWLANVGIIRAYTFTRVTSDNDQNRLNIATRIKGAHACEPLVRKLHRYFKEMA